MPVKHFIIVYLISTLIVFLPSFGFAKLFAKAGVESWKAYVPFYNTWVMQDLAKRPKHWVFWQFIPVIGWFISPGIFIEFAKLFNKFSLGQHTLASLAAPVYFPVIASKEETKFVGPEAVKMHKKSGAREWIDAAIFAVVAATLIRTFVFEAYTIPTGSMEKSLLVNDFLFVSKFSYGPRIPNTPLSIPFIHNYIPGTKAKSYTELISLPYIRWFASPVKRGDAVVFNFPEGDTVINRDGFQSAQPYYEFKRRLLRGGKEAAEANAILSDPDEYPLAVHPVDKRDNYIKRCVAIAGDSVRITGGQLYVNNQPVDYSPTQATNYIVQTNRPIDADAVEELGVKLSRSDENPDFMQYGNNVYLINLTKAETELVKKMPGVLSLVMESGELTAGRLFPFNAVSASWDIDNYGTIWVPKKGVQVTLTPANIDFYRRIITTYEHNTLEQRGDKFIINGKETGTYTFQMDYYWMMGDNRHRSQDSRFWGFVPEDHIVGKAKLIWFSYEKGKGVRWNRLFRSAK